MTFSVVVAYGVFALTSFAFVAITADALTPKSELEKMQYKLKGYSTKYNWRRIFVLFLVWFGAGVFLFG